MNNFYIIANSNKRDHIWQTVEETEGYFKRHGAFCLVQDQDFKKDSGRYTDASLVPDNIDCVITIGGDGTLIQAARDLAGRDIPLIGINQGHLGYLTQVRSKEDISSMADALLSERYQIENRMMLDGKILRQGKEIASDIALNEIVLTHRNTIQILRFGVYVNGEFLNQYTADGLIAATPTGSTAYNLSAGGPIVSPSASMMIMTPLAPHTLNSRSVVFSPGDVLCVEVGEGRKVSEEQAIVSFDGDTMLRMVTKDKLIIEKANVKTRIVRLSNLSFVEVLRKKMRNH